MKTFTPFTVENDRVTLAPEQDWRKVLEWDNIAGDIITHYDKKGMLDETVDYRIPVALTVDPFAEWPDNPTEVLGVDDYPVNEWKNLEGYITELETAQRKRLFNLIDQTPNLVWHVTTAFPERALELWPTEEVTYTYGGERNTDILRKVRDNIHLTIPNGKYLDEGDWLKWDRAAEQLRGLVGKLIIKGECDGNTM